MGRSKGNCRPTIRVASDQAANDAAPSLAFLFLVFGAHGAEAFAAVRADGRVVTWGSGGSGGNSNEVQETIEQLGAK